LEAALDEQALGDTREALRRLGAEPVTFEDFAVAAKLPQPPQAAPFSWDEFVAAASVRGLEEMRKLFDAKDKNGDGKVSGSAWGTILKQNQTLLARYFRGSTSKRILTIDTNAGVALTWDEFVAAAGLGETAAREDLGRKSVLLTQSLAELHSLFQSLDKDGDDTVSKQEWNVAVKKHQETLGKYFGGTTVKEIKDAFKRIDVDGNASLSWQAFVAAAGLGNLSGSGLGLLHGWFESLGDADGNVLRNDLKERIESDAALCRDVFDEETMDMIRKAIKTLKHDKFSFEEFALEARFADPEISTMYAEISTLYAGKGQSADPEIADKESAEADIDTDPVGVKKAARYAELFSMLQSWHSDMAGGVDGRVELAHWKSSLLKRLEDLKSVATDDEIRQVVQSFAALEAETESRECSFEEFIAASGLPPAQAVPEIGMPTDAVRKLLQEIFESIAEESGEGKLEDFRAELKPRLQEGLGSALDAQTLANLSSAFVALRLSRTLRFEEFAAAARLISGEELVRGWFESLADGDGTAKMDGA
jgi:Ca2+-binding EF-hand superfamily protein